MRPPATLLHLRPNEPRQPDRGEQLLIEVLAPDLVGDLLEGAGARGSGVVHHDVDLAERRHGLVVGARDIARDGDVPLHGNDAAAAARSNGLGRRIERFTSAGNDGDVGA